MFTPSKVASSTIERGTRIVMHTISSVNCLGRAMVTHPLLQGRGEPSIPSSIPPEDI